MGFNSFMGSDTPRNLFAFKDGTINPKKTELDKEVWIKGGVFDKGSYLITRKVVMHLETWDRTHLKGQNETFGRQRDSGAPFGKTGEFDEKYLHKGTKVVLDGEMQNDNYQNKQGQMVYGFRVIVNSIEFAESKAASQSSAAAPVPQPPQGGGSDEQPAAPSDDFMNVPNSVEEALPFD